MRNDSLQVYEAASRDFLREALQGQDIPVALTMAGEILTLKVIADDEQAARVSDVAKICKVGAETLAADLKTITAPLRAAEAAARALAAPGIDPLEAAVKHCRALLTTWQRELDRRAEVARQEALRKVREEQERVERETAAAKAIEAEGEMPAPVVAPVVVPEPVVVETKVVGAVSTTGGRRNLVVSVADLVKLAQSHPELLVLDQKKAKEVFRARIWAACVEVFNATGNTPTEAESEALAIEKLASEGLECRYEKGVVIS